MDISSLSSLISPISPKRQSLVAQPGVPLASEPSLVPPKYLSLHSDIDPKSTSSSQPISSHASSINLRPAQYPTSPAPPHLNLVRSPPSQLLDAPARAATSMPNASTAPGQARAVRGGEAKTPEYEIDDGEALNGNGGYPYTNEAEECTHLLAPTPIRPELSRSSSAASNRSSRSILRRIFIDRTSTPSQHLSRPTFPPPSLSTYSPLSHTPLSFSAKVNLLIGTIISTILSTFFLSIVVTWAMAAELSRALPKWIWPDRPKKFPWDDDKYWRREGRKVSKDPTDYARQIGMDIEHQTVETEDGYYLKCVGSSGGC